MTKTALFAAAVSLLSVSAARAAVAVERPAGKICYHSANIILCVHDEDAPAGVSYTTSKGVKPETWSYVDRRALGGLALTREGLGSDRFADEAGLTHAMTVILTKSAAGEGVSVEKKSGKICYAFHTMKLCVHDEDAPAGISYCLDTSAKPAEWPYASVKQLGQPLTRQSLGSARFDQPEGFLTAIQAAKAATLMKKSEALEGLIRQASAE